MSIWDFLKKEKDKEETSDSSGTEDNQEAKGHDKVLHAMDAGHDVPEALSKKLAEIRGEQEPEFVEVAVNEDGTAVDPEQAELLKTGSVVKDDDTTSGDAENNQGDKSQESEEAEADDSSDSSSKEDTVVLTPRLVAAGETLGWDEARIKRVAASDVTILEDLASQLENKESHRRDDKDDKDGTSNTDEGQTESPALKKLREKLGDEADDVLNTIAAGVRESLSSEFADVKELKDATAKKAAADESAARENIANQVFDMVADTFNEFGKTKDIPTTADGQLDFESGQMKVRAEVYSMAMKFHKANGGSFELALRDAVQHYAGGQREQIAVRQIVKDANRNKKRFTPKPTRRKTVKVFKNSQDKAAHIGREAKRKAGLL
ncbi:MAG: hypothetical protein ACXABY_02745 [Candidatus Thorarchaeota archaeon]|jgi:hypothetical protein